jgi:hypothetical protein
MVVVGAIVGQRWGVGGVAVCVSIAMGINWLNMTQLGRTVTGLDWGRFARAHVAPALLAVVTGAVATLAAEVSRSAHLGAIPLVAVAGLAALLAAAAAARLSPALFLGPHGAWAWREGEALLRRRARKGSRAAASKPDALAPAGKAGPP